MMMYMHCRKCLQEIPRGESPSSYAWLEVFVEDNEIVVNCSRHNLEIVTLPLAIDMGDVHCEDCGSH